MTHVAHRRRGHGVAGVDVVQTAGGIGLAGHNIADAIGAVGAGQADVHDGIDLLVRLQFTQLHGGNGSDQHDDLIEFLGDKVHQLTLVGGQRQCIAGANALRHAFHAGLVVSALAVAAAQHHDRRVAVLLQAVLVGGIGLLQLGGRSLAGIVHEVIGLVAGPAGIGRAQAQGGVDLLHSGVDSQTGSLQAIDHGGAVIGPAGAQGQVAAVAEHGHLGAAAQGQGGIVILQQNGAFLADAGAQFLMDGFILGHIQDAVGQEVFIRDKSGVALAVLFGDDLLADRLEGLVDHGPVVFQDCRGQDADDEHEGHHAGKTSEKIRFLQHVFLPFLSYVNECLQWYMPLQDADTHPGLSN